MNDVTRGALDGLDTTRGYRVFEFPDATSIIILPAGVTTFTVHTAASLVTDTGDEDEEPLSYEAYLPPVVPSPTRAIAPKIVRRSPPISREQARLRIRRAR